MEEDWNDKNMNVEEEQGRGWKGNRSTVMKVLFWARTTRMVLDKVPPKEPVKTPADKNQFVRSRQKKKEDVSASLITQTEVVQRTSWRTSWRTLLQNFLENLLENLLGDLLENLLENLLQNLLENPLENPWRVWRRFSKPLQPLQTPPTSSQC